MTKSACCTRKVSNSLLRCQFHRDPRAPSLQRLAQHVVALLLPKTFRALCDSKGGLAILHEVEPCQPKLEGDLTQSQSLMQVLEANTLSQKSELHLTQRLLVQMEGKSAG
jgi:hypothetical protein